MRVFVYAWGVQVLRLDFQATVCVTAGTSAAFVFDSGDATATSTDAAAAAVVDCSGLPRVSRAVPGELQSVAQQVCTHTRHAHHAATQACPVHCSERAMKAQKHLKLVACLVSYPHVLKGYRHRRFVYSG